MKNLTERLSNWYESYSENRTGPAGFSDIQRAVGGGTFSPEALQILLSERAGRELEFLCERAAQIKTSYFGNTVKLFTPLYISNYCTNGCLYCAFRKDNRIQRMQLSPGELEQEIETIAATGMRHILVLTGEAPELTTFEYLRESLLRVARRFSSVSIEVYPMSEEEYRILTADVPLDGVTVYQETYNRNEYARYHVYGQKRDYDWRLETADRACRAGVRTITVGALLGLDDPLRELGALAIHLDYLTKTYPGVTPVVSFPRLRPIAGQAFNVPYPVDDRFFTQIVAAFRILFPHVGITMSTRENVRIRNGLVPIGVTKMSAGVSTSVGEDPHHERSEGQFEIADERSLDEVCSWLHDAGYQPVIHDWNSRLVAGD
ncbi:MAG: 2-iminoacetate synthase ThiH [Fibrobacterota bacterium]